MPKCYVVWNIQFFVILSKLTNRPTTHLDLVVCMFVQDFYTFNIFPNQLVITNWKAKRVHYKGEEYMSPNVCCYN